MAEGSKNLRGRASDASKPYDVSNSFVKRVASRVTGLLPQSSSSWLSRWVSTGSTSMPNVNDYGSLPLSSTTALRPPATSRAELNLIDSVDNHIPAKKPRTNRYSSPTSQKNLRNDVYGPEDLSPITVRGEPVAGPSNVRQELVASTPAIHVKPQSSTKVNGDDCSETSESTSGCSSLVPQAQSTIRSLGGTRYGQGNFLPVSMDSLHRRRPSFSTTTFASPLRASMRERLGSSPFYSGRTMYGGSSQAYFSTIHSPQRRIGPTVKPIPAQESLPLSSTAKRILDALEQFSTPVTDAKRMPVTVGTKRKMESEMQRYSELNIPSTADLLRVKRRERLQQSTSAARQTATASLVAPQSPVEYSIRKEDSNRKKPTGKVKTKEKLDDDTLIEVKLPSVVLPVENLPKIDIAIPPPPPAIIVDRSQFSTPTSMNFKFATPTAVSHSVVLPSNLPSSNFNFSIPISEKSCKTSISNNKPVLSTRVSPLSRTSNDRTSIFKRHRSKDDVSVESSVTSLLSERAVKTLDDSTNVSKKQTKLTTSFTTQPVGETSECKQCRLVSVKPGTPCPSCQKMQNKNSINNEIECISNARECSVCKKKILVNEDTCETCQAKTNLKSINLAKNNIKSPTTAGFSSFFKKPIGTWECSACMIKNKNEVEKCVSCESTKPVKNENNNSTKVDPTKKESEMWVCGSCWVKNKSNDLKCVACTAPKTSKKEGVPNVSKSESLLPAKQTGNGFGNMFKKAPGSWTCEVCMITNNVDKLKCVACETTKPGVTLPKTLEASTPKFSFGIPASANCSSDITTNYSFGIVKEDQTKLDEKSSFVMPKTTLNADSSQTQTFSFGIPNTIKSDKENSSTVTSSTSSKPVYQFGSTSDTQPADSKSVIANTNKQTEQEQSNTMEPALPVACSAVSTTVPATNTTNSIKPVAITFSNKNEKSTSDQEKVNNAAPMFAFGAKATHNPNDRNNYSSLPAKTSQTNFIFGTKQGNANPASSASTLSSSTSSNLFKFGETKSETSGEEVSSKPQTSVANSKVNNIFAFGSSTNKKEGNFEAVGTKEIMTSNAVGVTQNDNKPTFGSFGTTNTPSLAFGNNSTFGSANFGSKEQSSSPFVPQTTTNIFGTSDSMSASTVSTISGFGQTNVFPTVAQESKPSPVFTFGSTPSKEPTTGDFVFNPVTEKRNEPVFMFPSTQTNTAGPTFGFNNSTSAPAANFNFEPKPFGPAAVSPFSATTDAPNAIFGTANTQSTPAFGEQATSNPVFAFGSQPQTSQQTPANPMFEFGSNQQQGTAVVPAPTTAFMFGATSTTAPTPTPAFDPNIKPTFNFTQGGAPAVFSAIPAVNSTATLQPQRKIRKAVRRTNISSVRQT